MKNDDRKPDAWMPVLIGAYLGDTSHLTTEQHGAYFLLLLAAWKRGGSLLNDDSQLRQITRLLPAQWRASRAVLLDFWDEEGGLLVQKRLVEEYARAVAFNERQKGNGAKGGRPPKNPEETHGLSLGSARRNPDETPSPSPIPKQEQKHVRQAARFLEFWRAMPARRGTSKPNKKGCRLKWEARNLDALADVILADVDLRKRTDSRWTEGFPPDPMTYLNQDRWDDDKPEAVKPACATNPGGTSPAKTETPEDKAAAAAAHGEYLRRLGYAPDGP